MNVIPKLTRARLAQLQPGSRLKIGNKIVTFDGYLTEKNYRGSLENFVHYTDSDGTQQRFSEFIILDAATESLSAVRCTWCGKFRAPDDIAKKTIYFWNRREFQPFCATTECARHYQQTIRVPSQTRAHLNKRYAA